MDWLVECAAEAIDLKHNLVSTVEKRQVFNKAAQLLARAVLGGGKVMACGNGGSASDASHFVGEMLGRFMAERPSLPAVSLVSDPATMTAIGNDYGYHKVFSRQVEGLGKPGDALLAISTSGKSPNVLEAAVVAKRRGIAVIGLMGRVPSPLAELCDVVFAVPGSCAARIQEVHIFIIHSLCALIERELALLSRSGEPLLPGAIPG